MNIKTKLRFGFGLLFIIILILGGLSAYYINKLSTDSKLVLKDNYETLQYSRLMLNQLEGLELFTNAASLKQFEDQLLKQEKNITEPGEGALTAKLRYHFEQLKMVNEAVNFNIHQLAIRNSINKIMDLNLKSITRKNEIAKKTAGNATFFLVFWGSICLLITFSFIINFPGYIANPIRDLTEGIKEIASKNYDKRLHFTSKDEFGELAIAFNSMAEKLDSYEHSNLAKILFEKKRIETIINSMNDGVLGLDENQIILFINPVALLFFGLKETDLVGKYAPDIALKNDLLRNLLTRTEQKEIKIYANEKESFFHKEVVEIIVPDNDGSVERAFITSSKTVGKVIILKNITSFHELDEAKTNFMATISHELKTPISSIKMSLKLLKDIRIGTVNTEQSDLIKNIDEDTSRLLKLTTEMLDLTQIETGNIQLNIQQTDAKAIVDYAVEATKFAATQKQIDWKIEIDEALSFVQADIEKTAWVLINFISNAIRYSPDKGKIEIAVVQKENFIAFTVKDAGKGIDEKYQKRIFDRYFQVPTETAQKGGTGLGLAISKEFIEVQGGKIGVKSELGLGSRFYFKLAIV